MSTPTKAQLLSLLQSEKLGSAASDALQQYVISMNLDKTYNANWGAYATVDLPSGSDVQVGEVAFDTTIGQLVVCTSVNPVVWTSTGGASVTATRVIHTPGVTPTNATMIPGQGPEPVVIGSLVTLHFKRDNDKVYGYSKIPTSYVSDASFHIHWTKETNLSLTPLNNTVRWQIVYRVFDGSSQDVSSAPTGTLILDDTYDDAGTTTRIIYRTANAVAAGFVPGWYVAFEISFVAGSTTLPNRPSIVSCDILSRQLINQGN